MKFTRYLALVTAPIILATSVAFANPGTFFQYQKDGGWNMVKLFGAANAVSCLILARSAGVTHTPHRD